MKVASSTAWKGRLAGWILIAACLLASAPRAPAQALVLEGRIELPSVRGRIDHLAVDVAEGRLFVAALGSDSLEVVDLKEGKRIDRIQGLHEPQGVAYWPESRRVFVANGSGGGVQAFLDGKAPAMASAPDLDDADNLRFDPKTRLLYTGYGKALAAINPDTLRVMQRIDLAGHPESFQLDDAGRFIYVNVPSASHIAVVERTSGRVVATWALAAASSNFPMALDESRKRLFVATRQPPLLIAYDLASGKEVDRLRICGDADDLFVDHSRQRLYVVCGQGLVEVVGAAEGNRLRVVERTATTQGARTGLFVPGLARLFIAVPSRGGSVAEIRMYKPQ